MNTTIQKTDNSIKITTVITTAKDMFIYNRKTYTHTEYRTEVDSFLEDNCEWLFYSVYPFKIQDKDVIGTIVITNVDKIKLEKGFEIFSKYLNTFLTYN